MTLLDAALAYAKRGWPVFPCAPGGKTPLTAHGFKDASTEAKQIRAWWKATPEANIGIATGEASGIYVLDVDAKPWRTIEEALAKLGTVPDTPTVQTGGGGVQFYFRYPAGQRLSISGGRLGDGVDTRGEGGYVIAPPSLHASGRRYAWWEFEDEDLAETPAWIIERLQEQRTKRALADEQRILPGGRHDTLMTAAAMMRAIGLVPREIEAALHQMVHRLDLSDGRVIADKEIADIAAWCATKEVGKLNIEDLAHGKQVADDLLQAHGLAEDYGGGARVLDPGPFPKHLLAVPGIVGELLRYVDGIAHRSQPVLALGAAIAAVGVLAGRKVQTEGGSRTNVYCLGVCSAGGGKDAARQAIKQVWLQAGADTLIGPEDIASESGMIAALQHQPSLLFLLDEIGHLLRTATDARASAHLAGIVTSLLRLYSSAGSVYKGKAYADAKRNPVVDQPNACLYGTTTPETLWGSLSAASITDGLLARMLVFVPDDQRPPRQARRSVDSGTLVDAVQAWCGRRGGGNLSAQHPDPEVVGSTDGARGILRQLAEEEDRECRRLAGDPLATVWTRVVQKADQLSLIYACSRSATDLVIDEAAARWGAELAVYTTRRLAFEASRNISENQTEAQVKRVLRIIEDSGEQGIAQAALLRTCRWLRARERGEFLQTLIDSGEVVLEHVATGGRPRLVYRARRHASASA